MIHLKYDTKKNSEAADQKLVFRYLYWACFIGKKDIVEYIIRKGYSPYVKSFSLQSAMLAAVSNGQTEIVKMLLDFDFRPTDQKYFDMTMLGRDKHGNSALHLAYKMVHPHITKLLLDSGDFNDIALKGRNNRGHLPVNMNHKKLYDDEFEVDKEADYCFVVKESRSAFLKAQLEELNLKYEVYPCT